MSTNHDLSDTHALIRAGERLNVTPYPGEATADFAVRIADAYNAKEGRRRAGKIARVGLAAILALYGIGGF